MSKDDIGYEVKFCPISGDFCGDDCAWYMSAGVSGTCAIKYIAQELKNMRVKKSK